VTKALLVIDVQNDYFAGGGFPLWDAEGTLERIEQAIAAARASAVPVILVQHVADASAGPAPFFNAGTDGVAVHPRILAAAPDAPVIVKAFADGFVQTALEETLASLGVTDLIVCGMMTQNCVTHTAISRSADKYAVTVLTDGCTTVSEILHLIALNGLSTRVALLPASEAFGAA
jgi:nicotinamidase-related amidase